MADSKIESVWQLISEYTLEVDSTLYNLTCGICQKLMIDACQIVCGCQFCYKCISEYLADEDKYCPGKNEDCKEVKLKLDKHVLKNSILNKKILTAKVRCPNQSCECNIVLQELEDHLRVCTKKQTKCPFAQIGCDNERASKDTIVSHLQNETLTHSELLIELIHNLKNEVDGLKDKFESSQSEISSLREELRVKDVQINEIKVQMGEQKRELECLKKESRDKKNELVILETEFGEVKSGIETKFTAIMRETEKMEKEKEEQGREMSERIEKQAREVEDVKKDSKKKAIVMEELKEELRKVRNEMELRLTAIIGETKKREGQMEVQRQSIEDVRSGMKEGREKCDEDREKRIINWCILKQLLPNIDVDFVWRIDEFTKKMDTMRNKRIFSESFHSNNYKLCLYLYIQNDGDGIALCCVIMRGDNDDKVQWPMRLSVTLGILNQDTLRTHKCGTTEYDTHTIDSRSVFNRPMKDMNDSGIAVLYPPVKYSSIKDNKSVVADNSIIVSCVIGDRSHSVTTLKVKRPT